MASRRYIAEYDTSPPARRRALDGLQALDMAQARWRRHNGADQAGLGTVARQQEPGGVRNDVDPEREQPQPCPTRRSTPRARILVRPAAATTTAPRSSPR